MLPDGLEWLASVWPARRSSDAEPCQPAISIPSGPYTEEQVRAIVMAAVRAERWACARLCAELWAKRETWADECALAILKGLAND